MTCTIDRRGVLVGLAAGPALSLTAMAQSSAPPTKEFTAALDAVLQGRVPGNGRIRLEIPRLAESGSSVECSITADSPVTAAGQVRTIHLLSEQNPIARIATFHFAPGSGPILIETSIRLRTTQHVHALAELSDGSLWADKAESVVLLAACLDAG